MNLKTRFSLIGGGIVIFLILTPILVLYARGFKYDFETRSLIKTGTLVVRTEPADVRLFLNDDSKADQAPATIRFLLPADYNLKLEKDGYQTWTKRLTIHSQFVTWGSLERDKIFLLYREPKLNSSWKVEAVSVSRDNSEITFQNDGTDYKIAINSGELDTLGQATAIQLPKTPATAKVFWTNANQIWQLLQTTDAWPLSATEFSQIKEVHTNGNHTAVLIGNGLYSFDITSMLLIDENVSGLTLSGDDVWYAAETELKHYSFSTGKTDTLASDFPAGVDVEIIRGGSQIYAIVDKKLYQLKDRMEKLYNSVTFARWEENGQRLVYGNSNEVYLHDPLANSSVLALRSLTPIAQVQLNWPTGYLFYESENKIQAAELDTRNGQNQFSLLKLPAGAIFVVSADGSKVYIMAAGAFTQYLLR